MRQCTPIQAPLAGCAAKLRYPCPIKGEGSRGPSPLMGEGCQALVRHAPRRGWMGVIVRQLKS